MERESGSRAARHDAEVIGLIGLAHGTSHFFQLLLPPLFPWLMADYALSFTQAGFLMTVFFVVSGIGQALAGFVVDRYGPRPVLFFGLGLLATSALVLAFVDSYVGLMLVAALAGSANAVFHPTDFTLLNRNVSTPRLGHAFSVHGLTGNLGWAAASVVIPSVAALAGWRAAATVAALFGFAVLGLLWWRRACLSDAAEVLVAPVPGQAQGGAATVPPVAIQAGPFAFLASGAVWMCFFFFMITTVPLGIMQNYSPAILSNVYGLALPLATGGLTAYLLGSAIGIIGGGFVAARGTEADLAIAVALGVSAATALLLATGLPPPWAVLPLMTLAGIGVGIAGPNRDMLVRRAATAQFGRAAYGRVYGFVYSGLDVGLALTPLVFGPMLDAGTYRAPLLGMALLMVAALALAMAVGSGVRRTSPSRPQGA